VADRFLIETAELRKRYEETELHGSK